MPRRGVGVTTIHRRGTVRIRVQRIGEIGWGVGGDFGIQRRCGGSSGAGAAGGQVKQMKPMKQGVDLPQPAYHPVDPRNQYIPSYPRQKITGGCGRDQGGRRMEWTMRVWDEFQRERTQDGWKKHKMDEVVRGEG